jgi:DNA-binding transcriptional ArsR family regulator
MTDGVVTPAMSLLPSKPDASPSEDAGPRVVGVDSDEADEVLSALSSGTARRLLTAVHDDPAPPSELADRVDTSLQNAQYHLEKLEDAGAVEVVDTAYSAKGREMDVYAAADKPLVIFAGDQDEGSMLRTALERLVGALGALAAASLGVQALFGREDLLGGGADSAAPAGGAGGDGGGRAGDGAGGAGGDGGDGGGVDVASSEGGGGPTPTPEAERAAAESATPTPAPEGGATPTPEVTGAADAVTAQPAVTPGAAETGAEAAQQAGDGTVGTAAAVGREAAGGLPPGLLFFAGGAFVLVVVAAVWYWRR